MYKKIQTIEDLKNLGIGDVYCDIGHRGGGIGFYSQNIADHFGVSFAELPNKVGAGCNYLGGGLRGSIFATDVTGHVLDEKKAKKINALAVACKRVYENIENESGLNDDEYEDGDINWESQGTKACRNAGVESAY